MSADDDLRNLEAGRFWKDTDPAVGICAATRPQPLVRELREALARGFAPIMWPILLERHRDRLRQRADAVLALPEVAALRAKAAAADRVRECIDGMDPVEVALGGLMYVHGEVRAALDGPPS